MDDPKEGRWALIVHGGAKEMEPGEEQANREGVRQAAGAGAAVLKQGGNLATGTSTGGLTGARVGRIGDSPMPGNGLYADNHIGAVSFSGDGESIARLALAAQVMASIGEDGPEQAIRKAVEQLPGVGGASGDGGAIAIGKDGRIGWAHNSPAFAVACASGDDPEPRAFLKKDEEKRG